MLGLKKNFSENLLLTKRRAVYKGIVSEEKGEDEAVSEDEEEIHVDAQTNQQNHEPQVSLRQMGRIFFSGYWISGSRAGYQNEPQVSPRQID